ncbi:transcription elongation factor GreA [candidate division WWE3 bacterium]|uniref:Transcription elongation factor GreA n=1 Tax=candidate division WWE3 bacterium TaxID=2053526 RepID=A0A955LKN8_UNCKA|nr:transcription elongation factor GreA [candidate division WWE3 bacterium]
MDKKEYYLTQTGYDNLRAEYDRLKAEEWPNVVKRVSDARELGKLEDNQEFEEAKKAKDVIEGKLLEIEDILERASIIEEGKSGAKATVDIGSTVTVEVKGSRQTFTIVGSIEADPAQGKISHESPVGEQLLGLRQGDIVEIKLPSGTNLEYKIVKIHK